MSVARARTGALRMPLLLLNISATAHLEGNDSGVLRRNALAARQVLSEQAAP